MKFPICDACPLHAKLLQAYSDTTRLGPSFDLITANLALRLGQINLVSNNHEGEVQRVGRRSSDEEIVLPFL